MRAYFFGNMYLSSIQQGIQAAHATSEMFVKYGDPARPHDARGQQASAILNTWARDHKTMVLLNAGYGEEIHRLVDFFSSGANPFPWAQFYEGKDSLDGAITTVGIILPEEIYNAAKAFREAPVPGVDPWNGYKATVFELELATKLNNYGLAR